MAVLPLSGYCAELGAGSPGVVNAEIFRSAAVSAKSKSVRTGTGGVAAFSFEAYSWRAPVALFAVPGSRLIRVASPASQNGSTHAGQVWPVWQIGANGPLLHSPLPSGSMSAQWLLRSTISPPAVKCHER